MLIYEKTTYRLLLTSIGVCIVAGLIADGPLPAIQGFWALQWNPARLINDFTAIGGAGGALLNMSLMGILSLLLIKANGVSLSGPTVAATLTIMGFSLFGKTPVNALPIVLGVFLASRVSGKPFRAYLLMAMFGTALGPLASFMAFETGLHGPVGFLLGIAAGAAVGFILPALAMAMLRMHEGYNLYNIGLTCGFVGLFAAAVLAGARHDVTLGIVWNERPPLILQSLVPVLASLFIVWGAVLDGKKLKANLESLVRLSGRLPSDFMDSVSPGASLVNAGFLGLAGCAYLFLIGAPLNGPVIGGLLTVMGFANFGKHPRNCWPVAAGVIVATLLSGKALTAPGPVLAFLFATTLAPLAGEFGPLVGFAAGFTHLLLVERSAAWNGGLSLYNNGFAGGLTATLFVAVIQWFKALKNK